MRTKSSNKTTRRSSTPSSKSESPFSSSPKVTCGEWSISGLTPDPSEEVETELDDNALVKSNRFYRKIEFMGFSEIWKKIMDVTSLTSLTLFNRGVNSIGSNDEIKALFPNVSQLSIEINLLESWEKVFALSEQLPRLTVLDLNFNVLHFKHELTQFLNDFDAVTSQIGRPLARRLSEEIEPRPLPPLGREIEGITFDNLKVLSLKSCKMTFGRLMLIKAGFPQLEEIVLSQNACVDFESIEINETDFRQLKSMDLSMNRINSSHPIQLLNKFPSLENLNLTGNLLTDISNVSQLGRLKGLNLHQNQIKEVSFVNDLAKLTCVESLRITENVVLDLHDTVHVKYLAIASLANIKISNGTPLKPFEIKDCQIYYWKNAYHEYFTSNDKTHHNFIFSKFYKWARKTYAMFDYYLMKYESAYDCSKQMDYKRFVDMADEDLDRETKLIEDAMKSGQKGKAEASKKAKKKVEKKGKSPLCMIKFENPFQNVWKKIPFKVKMNFVLNFVKTKYKVKNKDDIKLVIFEYEKSSGFSLTLPIEDYNKTLGDYTDKESVTIQVNIK